MNLPPARDGPELDEAPTISKPVRACSLASADELVKAQT